jgi:hypothetical protein
MTWTYEKTIFACDRTISSLSTPQWGDRDEKIILINEL